MKSFAVFAFALSAAVSGVAAASATTSSLVPQASGYCQSKRNECQSSGDPNEALCAAEFAACQGCEKKYDQCRIAPDANMSLCASNLYNCVAKAFPASSTTSVTGSATTKTTASASSTSSIVPQQSGYCQYKRRECQSSGDPNEALCGAEFAACQGCQKKYNACRIAPDANMSLCASNLYNCVDKAFPASSTSSSTIGSNISTTAAPTITTGPTNTTTGGLGTTMSTSAPTTVPYNSANSLKASGILAIGGLAALLI